MCGLASDVAEMPHGRQEPTGCAGISDSRADRGLEAESSKLLCGRVHCWTIRLDPLVCPSTLNRLTRGIERNPVSFSNLIKGLCIAASASLSVASPMMDELLENDVTS